MATTEALFGQADPMQVEVGAPPDKSFPLSDDKSVAVLVDDPLLDWIRRSLEDAKPHNETFYKHAKEEFRFVAGHQMDPVDSDLLKKFGRPNNAFNTIQKFVRYIAGVESRSPEALLYRATDEHDAQANDDGENVTRAYEWATRRSDAALVRSRSFYDMLVCGIGGVDWYLDQVSESRPVPKPARISPFEMVFPKCSDQNMDGARWRGREVDMWPRDVMKKWPDSEDYILTTHPPDSRPDPKEIRFTVPNVATENYAGLSTPRKKGMVKVLEFQWWDDEDGFAFWDPATEAEAWLPEKKFDRYKQIANKTFDRAIQDEEERTRRIHRKIFLLERTKQLGKTGLIPGNHFTIPVMTGQWDEDEEQWYGFMRILMDPQRYSNKFFNQMLEIIAVQAKGGLLYEEGAIAPKQRKEFEQTYAKPGSTNEVAEGAISGNRIKEKVLPQISPGTMEMMKYAATMPEAVTGLQPSTLGLDSGGNVPQGTIRQRQSAGILLFSSEFDALSKFKKEEGRVVFAFLKIIADGRSLGPPSPYEPAVYSLDPRIFDREYDIFLDDTEQDPTMRAWFADTIKDLAPTLIRMNNFPPELLDYFNIPVKAREKIKQGFIQNQQEQMQAAQQGIKMGGRGQPQDPMEKQAKIMKLMADAEYSRAKAEHAGAGRMARDFKTLVSALAEAQRVKNETSRSKDEKAGNIVKNAAAISDLFNGMSGGDSTRDNARP